MISVEIVWDPSNPLNRSLALLQLENQIDMAIEGQYANGCTVEDPPDTLTAAMKRLRSQNGPPRWIKDTPLLKYLVD